MMIPMPIIAGVFQTPLACVDICSILTSPYTAWFPIVTIAVLVIVSVLAVIYMISPLIGRNDLKSWVRAKLFDEFASVAFILIFVVFGGIVFTIAPTAALNSTGLVPPTCNSIITSPMHPFVPGSYSNYDSIFFLSICDIWDFNNNVNRFAYGVFYISLIAAISPKISINEPGGPISSGLGLKDVAQYNFTQVGISTSFDFLPIEPIFFYVVPLLNSLYLLFVLSQVQQFLIGAAGLIYAILMAVGLVARTFGITRTFGNAMMAFAIGIGIIYPVMTMITYGFIDYSLGNAGLQFQNALGWTPAVSGITPWTIVQTIINVIIGGVAPLFSLFFAIQAFLVYGGLIGIGLTLIPLFNLTVTDVFIVDFSRSLGERMDFLSLLTRIV